MSAEKQPELSMRDVVLEELKKLHQEKYSEMTEDESLTYLLNNLHTRLPSNRGVDLKEITCSDNQEALKTIEEERKLPHYELMGTRVSKEERIQQGLSEKYLDNTDLDFLQDVQNAISETGINLDTLKSAVDSRYIKKSPDDARNIFLPIYIKLREKGYSHKDLVI